MRKGKTVRVGARRTAKSDAAMSRPQPAMGADDKRTPLTSRQKVAGCCANLAALPCTAAGSCGVAAVRSFQDYLPGVWAYTHDSPLLWNVFCCPLHVVPGCCCFCAFASCQGCCESTRCVEDWCVRKHPPGMSYAICRAAMRHDDEVAWCSNTMGELCVCWWITDRNPIQCTCPEGDCASMC